MVTFFTIWPRGSIVGGGVLNISGAMAPFMNSSVALTLLSCAVVECDVIFDIVLE
jgi:hypothetical protein